MPLSMTNSPQLAPAGEANGQTCLAESTAGFDTVLARLKPPAGRRSLIVRMLKYFSRSHRDVKGRNDDRHVAFDGYRNPQYDDKLERDRRYGTVYTVTEAANAYLVRLELPHRMPASSLKEMWQLSEVAPTYDFTIEVSNNVLGISARLHGEALRRLVCVSASFPSGFLTRIEFAEPVAEFKHRLRDQLLEVIVVKSGQPVTTDEPAAASRM
jgi:hypothetical protein